MIDGMPANTFSWPGSLNSKAPPPAKRAALSFRRLTKQHHQLLVSSNPTASQEARDSGAMSNRIPPRDRSRRRATPAERQQARAVARFVHARAAAGQPLVITLALVARQFPNITLETALLGWVFRKLLAPEHRGRTA
jgi:hypothetical protein